MIIDGRGATFAVKKYFNDTAGGWGTLAFEVDDVEYDNRDKVWVVKCRFFASIAAQQKVAYEVRVSDDGGISKVTKLKP